jgi:hypothetical protein
MTTDRIEKTILLHAPLKRVWRALSDSTEFGPFQAGRPLRGVIVPTTMDPEVAKAQKKHEGTPFEIKVDAQPTTQVAFSL